MQSETNYWSVPCGQWAGVPVRIHVGLALAAVLLIGIQFQLADSRWMAVFVLTCSVLAQVGSLGRQIGWGRVQGVRAHGIRGICLVPWGGWYEWYGVGPRQQTQLYAVGIMTNIGLLLVGWLGLQWIHAQVGQNPFSVLHPLRPPVMMWLHLDRWLLESFVWISGMMLGLRLLPIVPLDGGYLLESWSELRFPQVPLVQRLSLLFLVALAVACTVLISAFWIHPRVDSPLNPAWIWPLLLGIGLLFSARRHFLCRVHQYMSGLSEQPLGGGLTLTNYLATAGSGELPGDHLGGGFVPGYGRGFHSAEGMEFSAEGGDMQWEAPLREASETDEWEDWMTEHRGSRQQAREDREAAEEAMLDSILFKVGSSGIDSLSDDERDILNRVSQRFRRRRELRL